MVSSPCLCLLCAKRKTPTLIVALVVRQYFIDLPGLPSNGDADEFTAISGTPHVTCRKKQERKRVGKVDNFPLVMTQRPPGGQVLRLRDQPTKGMARLTCTGVSAATAINVLGQVVHLLPPAAWLLGATLKGHRRDVEGSFNPICVSAGFNEHVKRGRGERRSVIREK